MRFVEEQHEDAVVAVLRLVGELAGDGSLAQAEVVRHHEELLDLLRLAVLVDGDVLGLEAGDEVTFPVEDDGVHFDQRGRGFERRLALKQRKAAQRESQHVSFLVSAHASG